MYSASFFLTFALCIDGRDNHFVTLWKEMNVKISTRNIDICVTPTTTQSIEKRWQQQPSPKKETTHNQTPYICSKVKVKIGKRVRNRLLWSEDTNKGQHTYLCNIKCKFKDVNILHKRMHTACRHFVSVHEYTEYCERCVGLCWCIARIFRVFFYIGLKWLYRY